MEPTKKHGPLIELKLTGQKFTETFKFELFPRPQGCFSTKIPIEIGGHTYKLTLILQPEKSTNEPTTELAAPTGAG